MLPEGGLGQCYGVDAEEEDDGEVSQEEVVYVDSCKEDEIETNQSIPFEFTSAYQLFTEAEE